MLNKKKIPLYLLSLIPLAHIIKGVLPFDLTLVVYIILYLCAFHSLIIRRTHFTFLKIDFLFYAWALILIVGVIYSPYQLEASIKAMKFILLSLSLIFFTRLFIKEKKEMELFINYLLLNSTLLGYFVLVDFYFSGMENTRYLAFGTINQIPLSLLGAVAFLISIFLLYYKKLNYIVFAIVAFPSISLMAISGSKGPVLSMIVTLIILSPVYFKEIKIKFILFISVAILSLSRIQFVRNSLDLLISRFKTAGNDITTNNRLNIYDDTITIIKNNLIFGAGTEISFPSYPHNFFLEIISENGIILLLIIFCLIIAFLYYFLRFILEKSNNYVETIVLSLLICSFITLMFSYSYVDHKYFFLSIGLLLTYYKITKFKVNERRILLQKNYNKNISKFSER